MSLGAHQCKVVRTLCFECFRAERQRQRTAELLRAGHDAKAGEAAEEPRPDDRPHGFAAASAGHFGPASLSTRQIAHRRAMLASLQAQRTAAEK